MGLQNVHTDEFLRRVAKHHLPLVRVEDFVGYRISIPDSFTCTVKCKLPSFCMGVQLGIRSPRMGLLAGFHEFCSWVRGE